MPHQLRNPAGEAAMAGYMRRSDPALAWSTAVSSYQYLPKLRAFWPFSSVDESGNVYDLSGQGRTLTARNSVLTAIATDRIFPYALFSSGSSNYYDRTDENGLDLSAAFGFGCWVYFTTVPASTFGIISKWGTAGNRSYRITKTSANVIQVDVSGDGSAIVSATHTTTVAASGWYYVSGTYLANFSLSVHVATPEDDFPLEVENTTSIPASIFNSTSNLTVGRTITSDYLNGRMALAWMCESNVPDYIQFLLFQRTRRMFQA